MEVLSASDAKREFGELLIKAQHAPVGINKNGKPVAVLVSAAEYEEIEKLKEEMFQVAIQEGMDDVQAGRVKAGKDVFERLRKRIG